ncbi:MAG: GNAT family N-acetyltransferase [Bacteroidia bacterium]
MIFREAQVSDITQMQYVRNTVKENMLSNPALITDEAIEHFLTVRGKGWVCEIDNRIVGFANADLQDHNIWALFIQLEFAEKGIGKQLHNMMLDWYFSKTKETVWLGTSPNTRAEKFYRMQGWKEVGIHGKGEIKFEMTFDDWKNLYKVDQI